MPRDEKDGWTQVGHNESGTFLNDYYLGPRATEIALERFTLFNRLPVEIRYMIWQHALCPTNRMIGITLSDVENSDVEPEGSSSPDPETRNYSARVTTKHHVPPLLVVSHESRQVARSFYRVRFPVRPCRGGQETWQCLYFNPELDYLLVGTTACPRGFFAYFNYEFLTRDPKGIGIQNIVTLDDNQSHISPLPLDLISLDVPEAQSNALRTTITNLKNVVFRRLVRAEGRFMCDIYSLRQLRLNRSYPISTREECFEVLDQDPRHVAPDLTQVTLMRDPRSLSHPWFFMERHLGIDRSQHRPRYQYMLTSRLNGNHHPEYFHSDISSRSEAVRLFEDEQESWRSRWISSDGILGENWFSQLHPYPDTPESLEQTPLPAFGFWLLPLAALGEVGPGSNLRQSGDPRDTTQGNGWSSRRIADLSTYSPRLGVFHLH